MHKNALGQRVKPSQADQTVYVPQLGHLWQPPNTYRVFLFGDTDGSRIAGLYEAPGSSDRRYVQYEVDVRQCGRCMADRRRPAASAMSIRRAE